MTDENIAAEFEAERKRVYIPSPSPAAPPSPSVGFEQAASFFSALKEYEGWRQSVINTELTKLQTIEKTVAQRVETAISASATSEDPIMGEVAHEFISMIREARQTPQWHNQAPAAPTTTNNAIAPPAPSNEVPMKITQAQAQEAADYAFEHFPNDVIAVQKGEITPADALLKIKSIDKRISDDAAQQILTEIINTDYSSPEAADVQK